MKQNAKKMLMAVAAIAALALGGSALANAASTSNGSTGTTGSTGTSAKTGTAPDLSSKTSINPNEHLLTGDTAAKVKAAATAKVSGTVDRVETDDGGVYEAHITKADGTHVEVKVDKAFKVTAVNTMNGGDGDGDGPGH